MITPKSVRVNNYLNWTIFSKRLAHFLVYIYLEIIQI